MLVFKCLPVCRPEQLVMKDAGVLECPMCSTKKAVKRDIRWDMHGSDHGIAQRADARGYVGNIYNRAHGGGPVDCLSHPGGMGCAGPH